MTSVAILGGGVGGLSAAHELAERGFDVTVYEWRDTFGGKARSMTSGLGVGRSRGSARGTRLPILPGLLPACHRHDGTHPVRAGNGRSHLVHATRMLMAQAGGRNELIAPCEAADVASTISLCFAQFMWDFGVQLRIPVWSSRLCSTTVHAAHSRATNAV